MFCGLGLLISLLSCIWFTLFLLPICCGFLCLCSAMFVWMFTLWVFCLFDLIAVALLVVWLWDSWVWGWVGLFACRSTCCFSLFCMLCWCLR